MAFSTTPFSNKGSFMIVCFCLQFLFSSCWQMKVDDKVGNLNELSGLLDEFRVLEDQFDRVKCDEDFHQSYISLMQRIREFERKYYPTDESRKIRPYLYNAVLHREYNLKYNYESNLIQNITDYLGSFKKDLNTLRGPLNTRGKLEVLYKYERQYKLSIQNRMRESNNLIERFIMENLEKMEYDLSYKIDSLVVQIVEMYDTQSEKERLTGKEEKLKKSLVLQKLLTSFKLVGHVMSFLSASVVSAVWHVGGGSKSYRTRSGSYYPYISFCARSPNTERKLMEISSELKTLDEKIKSLHKPNIQPLNEILDRFYDVAGVYHQKFGYVLHNILDMKQKLTTGALNYHDFGNLEDVLQDELEMLQAEDSNELNKNMQITLIELIKITALGNSISNIIQNIGDDSSELQPGENFNHQNKVKLEMLKKYEDTIQGMVDKVLSGIKSEINLLKHHLKSGSTCSLMIAKWNVQLFLKETKKSFSEMTNLFDGEGKFLNFLEGFQEIMTALAENYDHIQNYLEQRFVISHIEDLIDYRIRHDINKTTNPQFIGAVDKLDLVIRSNIVLQRYRTAIDAFKQFVFPFASLYLHDLAPLNLNDKDAMARVVSQIEVVQSKLKLYEQSLRNTTNYIVKKEFKGNHNYYSPFFVWKNNDHRSAIRDLLSGKEILLKADISGSPKWMDAIKFEKIGLEIKASNGNLQGNFNEVLKNFRFRGVHLGNSYYKYDSKVYLISSSSREFDFPFEMEGMTGDMMMSPYASWRFTLVNMTDEADFKELAQYVEAVDLLLVGSGFYVEHYHEDLEVDKYYKPVDDYGNNWCHLI